MACEAGSRVSTTPVPPAATKSRMKICKGVILRSHPLQLVCVHWEWVAIVPFGECVRHGRWHAIRPDLRNLTGSRSELPLHRLETDLHGPPPQREWRQRQSEIQGRGSGSFHRSPG